LILPDPAGAYCVLWFETTEKKADGKYKHEGEAFQTIEEMAEAHPERARSLRVRTLYYCVSLQREAGRPYGTRSRRAIRTVPNTAAIKVLFVDLDVKPDFYSTTAEALQALFAFCNAIGLTHPTITVYTSAPADESDPNTSGVHAYWVLDRILTVEAWKPLARLFSNALQHGGVRFDRNVPTNAAWVGRAPGSINRKQSEPRVARLGPGTGETHDVEKIRAVLEAAQPPQRERSHDPELDPSAVSSLAEITDAVEFLIPRGHYGAGQYVNVRDLYFAVALVVVANPELYDAALAIMHRVVAANGRDPDKNAAWFQQAIERAPSWIGQQVVTLATTFAAARKLGWRPPITAAQRLAIDQGRGIVRGIFNSNLPRDEMATRAAIFIDRASDPVVRRKYGDFVCAQLVRRGWPDSVIINALRLAQRAEIDRVPDWISRLRRPA
jgi:hypothetical protein